MKKNALSIIIALAFTAGALITGYLSLGWLVMLIFSAGYLGGFILWLLVPSRVPFAAIKYPYWLTMVFFILLHKPEEKYMKFFETISAITGVAVPEATSVPVILMLIIGTVPWLLVPVLIKRGYELGYYFAWTLFACMGITELAHFLVFPFLVDGPYTYFPGMASVIVLAPIAWWGMYRLAKNSNDPKTENYEAATKG